MFKPMIAAAAASAMLIAGTADGAAATKFDCEDMAREMHQSATKLNDLMLGLDQQQRKMKSWKYYIDEEHAEEILHGMERLRGKVHEVRERMAEARDAYRALTIVFLRCAWE